MKALSIFLFTSFFSTCALADGSVAPDCKIPTIPAPGSAPLVVKYFDKHMAEYKKCINKYVDDKRAASTKTADVTLANKAHDEAEAAIAEYNGVMEELNSRNADAGEGSEPNK